MISFGLMAESREEEQRRTRRKRIIRGLLLGGAAVGVPALLNAVVSKRARQLPAPVWGQGARFQWQSGDIIHRQLGKGPPLLLLHSFGPGHSALEWRAVAEILGERYHVIVPDLLGWGESTADAAAFDSELYIQLVGDLLEHVVGERAVLVAAGLSAAYAVQVAADRPEAVRALALVAPLGLGIHGDEPDFKDAIVHHLLRLPVLGTSALNVFTSRSALASYLRREVFANAEEVVDTLVEEHYRNSHQKEAQAALAAYLSGYLNHGVRDSLNQLDMPVWLGWGRKAVSPPVESADLWLRQLPAADFDVFERCGILLHREAPQEFCRKLEPFLSKLND
jgi:pimeloyl-ACP methyl ester carboxylesterase